MASLAKIVLTCCNHRGEICSFSSADRKNFDRRPASIEKLPNKRMGHRQDLVIRKDEMVELAVGEEKSLDTDTNKFSDRGMKVPKAMKDTLFQLCSKVGFKKHLVNDLYVTGISTFGKLILFCVSYYIFILFIYFKV